MYGYESIVASLGDFIDAAKEKKVEHIIFDTGAGLDRTIVALSEHADRIIIVVEADEISLTAAVDLRAELLEHTRNLLFIVNKEPDDFPQSVNESLKEEITFIPSLPLDQKLHSRFVKDARRLALEGFRGTRYKRFVGVIANSVFGISAATPTALDRIFRKTAAKIFFRFLGYGVGFLFVLFCIFIAIGWWITS